MILTVFFKTTVINLDTLTVEKHNELFCLSKNLSLDIDYAQKRSD